MSDLVLVDHFSLLHFLNGDYFLCLLIAADAHFSKRASSDDFERLKVADGDLGTRKAEKFCFLVLDLLLNQLLLFGTQIHLVHLLQQFVPSYTLSIKPFVTYLPSSPSPRSLASRTSAQCMPLRPQPSLL